MATPVHAEQGSGSISAADQTWENTRRNDGDMEDAALTKAGQNGGKKSLKITAIISKTLATDESLSLSPPQNLRIITDPR
jgi:hypothetical protein